MKIQIDTQEKLISVNGKISIKELVELMKELLTLDKFKDYNILVNKSNTDDYININSPGYTSSNSINGTSATNGTIPVAIL